AKNGNAGMQAFVGAEFAAIAAHGTPVATVMDHLVKAVDHRQVSADQALAVFAGAGANGTGAVRNACADAMLTLVDHRRISGAQLDTFMANHLYDGLTESVLVSRVARGELQSDAVISTLNGLVDTHIKTHPGTSLSDAKSIMMASLEVAVTASIKSHPAVQPQNYWWGGGYNDPVP